MAKEDRGFGSMVRTDEGRIKQKEIAGQVSRGGRGRRVPPPVASEVGETVADLQ